MMPPAGTAIVDPAEGTRRISPMAQCKARTNSGAQCVREIKAPSKSLCTRHQNELAKGKDVINIATGRRFPKPKS